MGQKSPRELARAREKDVYCIPLAFSNLDRGFVLLNVDRASKQQVRKKFTASKRA